MEDQSKLLLLNELRKQTELLERILESVDTQVMAQDETNQSLDTIVDFIEGDDEPPVVKTGNYDLPGFDGDPLAGFPKIRKDKNGSTN